MLWSGLWVVSPRGFGFVSHSRRRFSCRTVTVRIYEVWTLLDLPLGIVVDPRSRVFFQPSATPDVGVGALTSPDVEGLFCCVHD